MSENTAAVGNALYADVIIDISHEQVDRSFSYFVPEDLRSKVRLGSCVVVPFGRGNTARKGYIIGFSGTTSFDPSKVKSIRGTARGERAADEVLIGLAVWMKSRYGSTMIAALKTVIPAHKKMKRLENKTVRLSCAPDEAREFYNSCVRKKHQARIRLMEALMESRDLPLPQSLITGKLHVQASVITALKNAGIVSVNSTHTYRNPVRTSLEAQKTRRGSQADGVDKAESATLADSGEDSIVGWSKITKDRLTSDQSRCAEGIMSDYEAGRFGTYLIRGVTGSGKTEIYIRLIEAVIEKGKQAIVLIPEIALTYQTLLRFYRHFGDRVSVMNSTLSAGEKSDQFARAKDREIDVMIGPRSALFTPFPNLGLIIIDEEHELTYKSETMPKYHAVDTAIELASLVPGGASVVLGSATPSLESYYLAKKGEYTLYELESRATGAELPATQVVDLRDELRNGNRSIFSAVLQELMADRLQKKEQIMLFLNRRGLAGFVSCRSCGHVFKCPHCDVSLSEHAGGTLICHYCGYTERASRTCPECGKDYVAAFKAGTQQIEREVIKMYPQARCLRMDADTTKTKNSYEKILSSFSNHEADVLIGTQMIVKGHDFHDVTLVGVLAADMSLNVSDFRAAERTFQLITQAAGRAGRGTKKGDVVIQTYQPEHYAITFGAAQDYKSFYEEEISYRRLLLYPPVAHMLAVQIFCKNERVGADFSEKMAENMKRLASDDGFLVIGPAPARISRIEDVYRFVIYAKHEETTVLQKLTEDLYALAIPPSVQVQYDMDPVRIF